MINKFKLIIGFFLLSCLCFPRFSLAQSPVGLVPAHPDINNKDSFSNFRFELSPSEQKKSDLAIVNTSDDKQTTSITLEENSWIKISSGPWELQPGERKLISFSVNVPEDAKPGDHKFRITANGSYVDIVIFVKGSVSKNIRVDRINFAAKDDKLAGKLEITNNGNVIINSLALKVTLENNLKLGSLKSQDYFWTKKEEIQPGQTISWNLEPEKNLPFAGSFRFNYELNYQFDKKTGSVLGFSYFNWIKALMYLLLLTAVICLVIFIVSKIIKLNVFLIRKIISPKKQLAAVSDDLHIKPSEYSKEELEYLVRKIIRQELRLFFEDQKNH
jgi:hypothetical protein